MVWFLVSQIFSTLISLVQIGRKTESDKDLEILVLRYQLGIADRKLNRTIKPDRIEKLTLAILINRLKSATNRSTNELRSSLRLFSPRTVFRWHNELVKRKWTYKHQNKGGRPRISHDREDLIVQLAKENPR
jgi:putative transposase